MTEPTVGFEGEEGVPVTQLAGWHEHPECPDSKGRPLAHMHGMGKQEPHTHLLVSTWGPKLPL